MEVLLGSYGALILAVLLSMAHRLGRGRVPLTVLGELRIDRPSRVGAWALVTSLMLVPATILILAFPSWVAL